MQRLKKDLSTEALKSMFDKFDAQTTAEDPGSRLADKVIIINVVTP